MKKALYYPYSRCVSEETLKRLILVFDTLVFVDPMPDLARKGLMRGYSLPQSITSDWQLIESQYDLLVDKGIVELVNPTEIIKSHDKALTAVFEADMMDDSLWRLHAEHDVDLPDIWYLLKERVPPSVFPLLTTSMAPGYFQFVGGSADAALNTRRRRETRIVWRDQIPDHMLRDRQRENLPFVSTTPLEVFDNVFRRLHTDLAWEYRQAEATGGYAFAIGLPYVTGSALALNQCLLLAEHHDAVLVTDSQLHHSMLGLKFDRSSNAVAAATDPLHARGSFGERQRYGRLALSVVDHFVNDSALRRLSISQCVKYREASRDALERFRVLLESLTAEIEGSVWDSSTEQRIRKIISQKIAPEAEIASTRLSEIRAKLFGSLSVTSATIAVPSLVASVFPGVTSGLALLFGSTAVAGGAAALAAKEVSDALAEQRSVSRNGLSYLVRLNAHSSTK